MAEPPTETSRVRAIWDRTAATYDRSARFDGWLLGNARRWAIGQAGAETLEIGVGTGRNLPLYDREAHVTGIDISPRMLDVARRRDQGRRFDLRLGDAQHLDFDDRSFDVVIATLVLCSVPDDRQAMAEAFRVLRPGGIFVIVEHVRSNFASIRAIERALDGRSVRTMGDHLLRDPIDHLVAVGFQVVSSRRTRLGVIERVLAVRPQPLPDALAARTQAGASAGEANERIPGRDIPRVTLALSDLGRQQRSMPIANLRGPRC